MPSFATRYRQSYSLFDAISRYSWCHVSPPDNAKATHFSIRSLTVSWCHVSPPDNASDDQFVVAPPGMGFMCFLEPQQRRLWPRIVTFSKVGLGETLAPFHLFRLYWHTLKTLNDITKLIMFSHNFHFSTFSKVRLGEEIKYTPLLDSTNGWTNKIHTYPLQIGGIFHLCAYSWWCLDGTWI